MDGNYRAYSYTASSQRIAGILDQPAGQFEEVNALPDPDRLTYSNGFYGRCSAVFVDIRDSSKLPSRYKRPRLAKLYRSFISEMVSVLNGYVFVREVSIVGDCVWATYNTPYTSNIDEVFSVAAEANTLRILLNKHLEKHDYEPLRLGIGADWGRVLMIKAGANGSGISDVVYMGDVVNSAAHLAHKAGRLWGNPIWVGSDFYGNLNEHDQELCTQQYDQDLASVYTSTAVLTGMNSWIDEQSTRPNAYCPEV